MRRLCRGALQTLIDDCNIKSLILALALKFRSRQDLGVQQHSTVTIRDELIVVQIDPLISKNANTHTVLLVCLLFWRTLRSSGLNDGNL